MGSPEEKAKHSRRLKRKKQERVRSVIAKELITSGRYKQRVIKDKRGKEIVTHYDLVQAIQQDDE